FGRDAEGIQDVGGAAAGGDGAVAVLGYLGAGSSRDQGCGGGDVEGAAAIAAGSAGVDDGGALLVGERQGSGEGAKGLGEAGDLGGGFPASGHGAEQRREFHFGNRAGENTLHERCRLASTQRRAILDYAAQLRTD